MRPSIVPFVALLAAGCATPFLIPANAESRLNGQVDVVASNAPPFPYDRSAPLGPGLDILNFKVENLSRTAQMKVDRDAIFLVGPAGRVNREPGGLQTVYDLAPGDVHDVNVRFSLDGFARGQMASVHFEEAITIGGQRVGIAPLTFQVR